MAVTTNYTDIAYIEEVTEGTTPATPNFQLLPTTGGSPVSNITTAVSEVIRSDRQTDDLVVVDSEVGGEINYELSYDPYKPFLRALLQNDTEVESINVTGITTADGTGTLSLAGIESSFEVDDVFQLSSATTPTVNGTYTVTALGTDDITVTPTVTGTTSDAVAFAAESVVGISANGGTSTTTLNKTDLHTEIGIGDVFRLQSGTDSTIDGVYTCTDNSTTDQIEVHPAFGAAFNQTDVVLNTTNIITNGADAPKSYTIRKKAIEGATPYYWYYRGCKVSSMNFNFATGSILNGSFNIVGLTEEATSTAISGETVTNVPAYSIMNSVSSIGTVYLEGVSLGTCSFQSLDLTYDNQINAAKSIGTLGACDTASFSVQITGSVEVYFQDLSLYNKFLNAESFGVTIILTDGDGNSIGLNMPKCKFETLDTPIGGKDQFLMQSGSFRALRDATDDYMFKLSLIDSL